MSDHDSPAFKPYIRDFSDCPPLGDRVLHVLLSLPTDVQRDFLDDPRFRVTVEQYIPGRGWTVFMNVPGTLGSGSRSFVLRPKLAKLPEPFAHWVIGHEFAHAFLRHGDGGDTSNVERDANALAAEWGYPRPDR